MLLVIFNIFCIFIWTYILMAFSFHFGRTLITLGVSLVTVKKICLQFRRPGFKPWVGKIPWRREWLPIPVFLPREFHGQRSLAGYSPWGHKEWDTQEWLTLSLITFTHISCSAWPSVGTHQWSLLVSVIAQFFLLHIFFYCLCLFFTYY